MSDTPEPQTPEVDDEVVTIVPDTVSLRRAPKFGVFIGLGAVVGLIVTFVLTSLFPVDPAVGFLALFAYFALYGITAGAVIGAVIAIVLDRVSRGRVKTARAERTSVEPGPVVGEVED